MKTVTRAIALTGLLVALCAQPVSADLWGTPVPETAWDNDNLLNENQRSTPAGSGLIAGGSSWPTSGFTVEWDIDFVEPTETTGGYFTYVYTFTTDGSTALTPQVSHWIMSITNDGGPLGVEYLDGGGGFEVGDPQEYNGESPSNPGLPWTDLNGNEEWDEGEGPMIWGVKLVEDADPDTDWDTTTFHFKSYRAPVWGDWYAKAASGDYAYNVGLTLPEGDEGRLEAVNFVARPNGMIPEPFSVAFIATALVGVVGVQIRRHRKGARKAS